MHASKFRVLLLTLATLATIVLATSLKASAQTEQVLHTFNSPGDGSQPFGGLIFDSAGNLYGTTSFGGAYTNGSVFELSPNGTGGFVYHLLYSFNPNLGDGANPYGALVFDNVGNLYGTTYGGGGGNSGTVFELSPQAGGVWTETIVHSFKPQQGDGRYPLAGLMMGSKGFLYGTTSQGGSGTTCGSSGCGTVFVLIPRSGGVWPEKIIHSFDGGTTDGASPVANIVLHSGKLYGTTQVGGAGGSVNSGTVFELAPNGSGSWTETILHSFTNAGSDGYNPDAAVVFDSAGNLYGTTNAGGANNYGTVFELSPNAGGNWTETVIHDFYSIPGVDGIYPESAGLTFDASGNLYGTAAAGGANANGIVYKLTPGSGGGWTETVVFAFNGTDGNQPVSGVTLDRINNIYGSTEYGGTNFGGTAFKIVP